MYKKEDLLKWYDKEYCLKRVKENGYNLEYVKNQTEDICLAAVKQNGFALSHVQNQTEDICIEALNQHPEAIRYVDIKKYPELYEKYIFIVK